MAVGHSDPVFVLCPVDVNEAVPRVRVPFLQPVQPENTTGYPIFCLRQWFVRLQRSPAFEDGSARHFVADFFADLETAKRRLVTSFFGAETKA